MLQANLLLYQKMETGKLSFEFGSVGLYYQSVLVHLVGQWKRECFRQLLCLKGLLFFFFKLVFSCCCLLCHKSISQFQFIGIVDLWSSS